MQLKPETRRRSCTKIKFQDNPAVNISMHGRAKTVAQGRFPEAHRLQVGTILTILFKFHVTPAAARNNASYF
jgi:hypothetical protein